MNKLIAMVLATGMGLATGVGGAWAKSCVRAGGEATMVTEDLAKFMAEAALKNSISGMGARPVGKISMKCSAPSPLTSCTARQEACK